MVYLASCNHDEEGRLGWEGKSKAGDQTGSEVAIMPYTTWSPSVWKATYRAKDPKVAWRIGQAGIQMCRNNHIGYDQSQRLTFYNEMMKTGNIDKITTDCETDCSAGTCACIIIAGYSNFTNSLRTAQWDAYMKRDGRFECLYDEKYTRTDKYLKTGDILLKDGHVVIVVSDGDSAEYYSQIPLYVLVVTGFTPVYTQPRVGNVLKGHSALGAGNKVDYCDEANGFYYVRIIDQWGWIPKDKAVREVPLPKIKVGDKVIFRGDRLYVSAGGGASTVVPDFEGTVKAMMDKNQFPYPVYVSSRSYDGWCKEVDLQRIN